MSKGDKIRGECVCMSVGGVCAEVGGGKRWGLPGPGAYRGVLRGDLLNNLKDRVRKSYGN